MKETIFTTEDADRLLGLADEFLEQWKEDQRQGYPDEEECEELSERIGEWDAIRPLLAAAPAMRDVLRAALHYWARSIEDENLEVSGADMVEWFFGTFVPAATTALAATEPPEDADQDETAPGDFRCPDCGATATEAGVVCRTCRRGVTEREG